MGLIERDWILTQNKIKPCDFFYVDFVEKAKELVEFLKNIKNCDLLIALTHMRAHNEE
jgi:hypothetical protein